MKAYSNRTKKSSRTRLFMIISTLCITLAILMGTSISAFAKSSKDAGYKYYTSIRIETGDTLWDIADLYTSGSAKEKQKYIEDICELNHLSLDGNIQSGEYITIYYYSDQVK